MYAGCFEHDVDPKRSLSLVSSAEAIVVAVEALFLPIQDLSLCSTTYRSTSISMVLLGQSRSDKDSDIMPAIALCRQSLQQILSTRPKRVSLETCRFQGRDPNGSSSFRYLRFDNPERRSA